MLTRRGAGLLGASAALWVVARSFGVPEAQMAAVAGCCLVVLAVLTTRLGSTRLVVDRVVSPATVPFGGDAEVTLHVHNVGTLPTVAADLCDTVPSVLADRPRGRLNILRPGGRTTVRYRLHGAQRGRFALGPATIEVRDPFGLAARTRQLDGHAEVTVHPPVHDLPPGLPLGGATTNGRDRRSSRRLGTGEELADVREYVRGDDLRSVHWPSTAHRGKLMVRQSEGAFAPRAVVLLDRRAGRHTGQGPTASIETAVAAAASASHHLASRGRTIVLLDGPLTGPAIPLPWEAVLEQLAAMQPADLDLGGLLLQVAQGAAGDGTLIAILTAPAPEELQHVVRAGRGFATRVALLIDAVGHAGSGRGVPGPVGDPAASAAALRAAGWRTTVLGPGDRIDHRWRDLLGRSRVAEVAR